MADQVNGAAAPPQIRVKLAKTIMSYGKPIDEITFREPTAADLVRYGVPVMINPFEGKLEFRPGEMNAIMAALANVPRSSLETMSSNDWMSCAWALYNFFMPTAGAVEAPTEASS